MKNIYEALRQKELELSQLEKEVEAALRVATPEGDEADNDNPDIGQFECGERRSAARLSGGTTEQGAGHSPSAAEKTPPKQMVPRPRLTCNRLYSTLRT